MHRGVDRQGNYRVIANYTTVRNVVFLALAAVLVWRFLKTGGPEMLKEM